MQGEKEQRNMDDYKQGDKTGCFDRKSEKRRLRQALKNRMNALSDEYCQEADQLIAERLFGLEEWREAEVVFCYVGTGREIDTSRIIDRRLAGGKRVGVPLCTGPGVMEVREIDGWDCLVPGRYGILEPKRECPLMEPEEIGLAVVPGLSFTADGVRLGYGGGYYDRYLPRVRGIKLALCREQCLSDSLPAEAHDLPMDLVLTEKSTYYLIHSVKV